MFIWSLFFAILSVVLSYLSLRFWKKDREEAVLINVSEQPALKDYLNCKNYQCNCGRIELLNEYYIVEFGGGAERLWDGIALRSVIKNKCNHQPVRGIQAKVVLISDGCFVINGNVSIFPESRPNYDVNDELIIYYNRHNIEKDDNPKEDKKLCDSNLASVKDNKNGDSKEDKRLYDCNLIAIKDEDSSNIAFFVFLDAKQHKSINNIKIVLE